MVAFRMSKPPLFTALLLSKPPLFTALLLVAAPSVSPAFESPLSSGVNFPDLVGRTLSGSNITVGRQDGLAKVVVMAFTGEGVKASQAWLEACREGAAARPELPSGEPLSSSPQTTVVCYDVRMVTGLPPLVRGLVEGRMRKGQKPEHRDQVVLVHKDKETWRERMMVIRDNENDPFIVMVDRQGRVQSLLQGAFNPATLKAEQAKLLAP
jgi:hypothetical protein